MNKKPAEQERTMQHELHRIGDGRPAVLRETERAVTPFGGLVVLVELMRKIDLLEAVRERLPFQYRSNNAYPPEQILLAFWLAVAGGATRFAHLQMLRADRALQHMCGVRSFCSDDTVRNFFQRFKAGEVATFFPPLWRWFLQLQPARECILDLDSTVMQRYGHQEGAEFGYNPDRRGRSHRPLIAFVSEPVQILHGWLRSGNAADNRGAVEFLMEALAAVPAHWRIAGVRADAAFFDQKLLTFLEEKQCLYIISVRRKEAVQDQVHRLEDWTQIDATTAVSEFTWGMTTWTRARRFIVVRLRLPDPDYQCLKGMPPGYDYRVFVTSRTEDAVWLWKHYDRRAAIEPRFSELKEDLAADNFCLKQFYSTEAAFLSVLFLFNLLSLLQSLTNAAQAPQQRPATLRLKLFTCGAIAGKCGRKFVLFMSTAWGGLKSRKPLLDAILQAQFSTSPKLNFTAATAPP